MKEDETVLEIQSEFFDHCDEVEKIHQSKERSEGEMPTEFKIFYPFIGQMKATSILRIH